MKIPGAWRIRKNWVQLNLRGIILVYHRIAELSFDPWSLSVSPARFEEHMRVIRKYGRPVQMLAMGKNLKRFSFGPKEIVISFDDGYADNFHNAMPVLMKYEIPATFFVITGTINSHQEFWWDELERIILTSHAIPEIFDLVISGTRYYWLVTSCPEHMRMEGIPKNCGTLSRAQLYNILWQILSNLTSNEKNETLARISLWAGQSSRPRSKNLPLTSEYLFSLMRSSLVEIGAHTVCHPMLSRLSREKQECEIVQSKQDLQNILGRTVTTFSYPHDDYSDETVELVKNAGFHCACTCAPTTVTRQSDVYRLPRFKVLDWDGEEFERRLKGLFQESTA